jgi:hypothetical protein
MTNVEEPINYGLQSPRLCTPKNPSRVECPLQLATWFVKKFEKAKATTDLDKAIRYISQAIETTPLAAAITPCD